MALATRLVALATRVGQEAKAIRAIAVAKYSLPGGGVPVADLSADARTFGVMIWQNYGQHAVGIGQQDIGWVAPYAMEIYAVRYWIKTAGTGGSPAAELRKGGIAVGNSITGTSGVPSLTPTYVYPTAQTLAAGDRLWVYQTGINTTTPGAQLAAEIIGRRL